MRRIVAYAPIALLLVYAALTYQQALVWQSDAGLWAYAYAVSPTKPRVVLNYAVTRFQAGDVETGVRLLLKAERLAEQAHVSAYDRLLTQRTVRNNLAALMASK